MIYIKNLINKYMQFTPEFIGKQSHKKVNPYTLFALAGLFLCSACTTSDHVSYRTASPQQHFSFDFITKKSSLEEELTRFIAYSESGKTCSIAELRNQQSIPLSKHSIQTLRRDAVKYWEKVLPEDSHSKNKLLNELEQTIHVQMATLNQSLNATGLNIAQQGNQFVIHKQQTSTNILLAKKGRHGAPLPITKTMALFAGNVPTPHYKNALQFAQTQRAEANQGGPFISPENYTERYKQISQNLYKLATLREIHQSIPVGIPMKKARQTSAFGPRRDPFNRRKAYHTGIDFSSSGNPPVHTTARGKVTFAGWKNGYGNMVIVDHGLGLTTRYAHLKSVIVKNGQKIGDRYTIGYQGSTGRSTGNHLHYEIRLNDSPINPTRFIRAGQTDCDAIRT